MTIAFMITSATIYFVYIPHSKLSISFSMFIISFYYIIISVSKKDLCHLDLLIPCEDRRIREDDEHVHDLRSKSVRNEL